MGQLDRTGETPRNDVLVFPVVQAGQFGIREEERTLSMLFSHLSEQQQLSAGSGDSYYNGPLMDITSGYFGLYKDYQDLVLRSNLRCRIIAASPKVRDRPCI